MEVIILGCGPSSSVPSMRCLMMKQCNVCMEAYENNHSKNRRLNPSLLIRNIETNTNILIDCGKTFRESALRIFPTIGISALHHVLLTHGHADACLGMDDLREVIEWTETFDTKTGEKQKISQSSLPVYCSAFTKEEICKRFDYLVDISPNPEANESTIVKKTYRWIAQLQVEIFQPFQPIKACGFQFIPLPVIHGADYISFGFEFGMEMHKRYIYISDVSAIPSDTKAYLLDTKRPKIDILIIDALYLKGVHGTHFNLQDVIREVRELQPLRTILTGMGHEFDYHNPPQILQTLLETDGLFLEMGYDGLCI